MLRSFAFRVLRAWLREFGGPAEAAPLVLGVMVGALAVASNVPSKVHAQAPDAVVLGVAHRGDDRLPEMEALAHSVAEELHRRGLRTVPLEEMGVRVERATSRPMVPPTASAIADLEREAESVKSALAAERFREVLSRVERVQALSGEMATLGRDGKAVEALFRVCVAGVQARLTIDDLQGARRVGTWCLATIPGLERSLGRAKLSRDVRTVLEEAAGILRTEGGPLTIESEPSGCTVILQGQRAANACVARHADQAAGTTPCTVEHAARLPYAVEVECAVRLASRVHLVNPAEKPRVLVDLRFDTALRTDHLVRFEYEAVDPSELRDHAKRIVALLGAREAVLVGAPSAKQWTIQRIGQRGTSVEIKAPYQDSDVRTALSILFHEELDAPARIFPTTPSSPPAEAPPIASAESEKEADREEPSAEPALPPPSRPRRQTWRLWAGLPLVATGAVLTVAAAANFRQRVRTGARYQVTAIDADDVLVRQRAWLSSRSKIYRLGVTGSLLASAGAALLPRTLEPDRRIALPIVTAVVAATGIALGIAELARAESCDVRTQVIVRPCVVGQGHLDRGSLYLLAAAPFATFSSAWLFQWLRPGFAPHLAPTAGRRGAGLLLSGSF